jgi:peptide deformylase
VFVYDVDDALGHLVNPVLHFPSDEEQDGEEGCLSVPGLTFDCVRKQHVVAHGQNVYGDPVTVSGEGLLARCVQHETDHLDGVIFIDRLDPRPSARRWRRSGWPSGPTSPSRGQGQPAPAVREAR